MSNANEKIFSILIFDPTFPIFIEQKYQQWRTWIHVSIIIGKGI
jgi:hypothetical protein